MPGATQQTAFSGSGRRGWQVMPALIAGVLLVSLAVLSVANSFIVHMTPDISIYLLDARTFVETLNRFTLSWENKGILLTFLLAPGVRLFGPVVWAAALVQLCAYAVAFYFLYRIVRQFASESASRLIVLMGICVVYSSYLWGAKERPEDFALACAAVCLYAALRAAPRWWIAGGAMMGCCALMKITLVVSPAAVMFAAAVMDAVRTQPEGGRAAKLFGNLARMAAGFAVIVGLGVAWVALFDDLGRCWLQTVAWPLHSRGHSMLDIHLYTHALRLICTCRLEFLFAGCVAGLAYGWRKGYQRAALLAGVFVAVDLLRIAAEGSQWPYLPTLMVIPLLVGASFFGCSGAEPARRWLAWTVPLALLAPLLLPAFFQQGRAFEMRAVRRLPSPNEYMAERMRPLYRPGESVLITANQEEIVLLLNAPRPAPVLQVHFARPEGAPVDEKTRTADHYAEFPPDWIVTGGSAKAPVRCTLGWLNGPYYVYPHPTEAALAEAAERVRVTPPRAGRDLTQIEPAMTAMAPTLRLYRLEVDIGCEQAWHLIPAAPPAVAFPK